MITTAPARANQACRRCYNRKKKCSRTLPRCQACEHSGVQCSFEEQQEETGLFYISYVRGLEQRVARLEAQLRDPSSTSPNLSVATPIEPSPPVLPDQDQPRSVAVQSDRATDASSALGQGSRISTKDERGDQLASELKQLSLEATADRYLGSSSGVSFARLTQAVLRRLKPDQLPFSFEVTQQDQPSENDISIAAPNNAPGNESSALQYPACLPPREQAFRLAEFYWSHTHTLYPFVRKVWFMERLKSMYSVTEPQSLESCGPWLYTMWMVFAIGSTTWSAIVPDGSESESVRFFNNAMTYFYRALSSGNMAALDALLLQVSYSFFNRVGSNTWYLVGSAIRLAVGTGLHTAPNDSTRQLPLDVQEYRKRLFWSLYMMDRVVSISLGRPFGICDDDIEVAIFTEVDDENILPDRILPQPPLKASEMAVPLHILSLRRIAGEIFEQVYSNKNRYLPPADRDEILGALHAKLVEWRRTMPFPLPQTRILQVPHTSTAWYDLNYYTHLIMLYRPSPLCPVLTLEKVHLIAEASAMAIRQIEAMHHDQRYAFNWLNLFNVFTITLTLIYSITAQPEALSTYLQRSDALKDLDRASSVLENFSTKFPTALKCRAIVHDVSQRLRSHMSPDDMTDSDGNDSGLRADKLLLSAPPGGLHLAPDGSQMDEISFPSFATGNLSFDELQNQVAGTGYSPGAGSAVGDSQNTASAMSDSGLPPDFRLAATTTPFGDAAAQFMAAGIGTGETAGMDLDEEFMNLLGGNFES
ncbi:c6 zinc finger domain containing protein [Diplodia corticola]|uniref:C6 zinc finger domain containing protein n=1 Tax=Diplodia corticola TaxID=236234 RepID=A0A1J9S3B2_9PEZI|nr:c6 zinc finger domain containing protein [Diplodia corticola]OJD35047.1 c6 zinc finger domain containing protein [Diplodia corticola]